MPNDRFSDLQIQHAIYLLRYSNGVDRDIQRLLAKLEKEVSAKLAQRLATIDERGHDLGPATTKRVNQAIGEIRELNGAVYGEAKSKLEGHLTDLASEEMEYTAKALRKSGIPAKAVIASPNRLKSIVTERPMQGKLLSSFLKGAEDGTAGRIEEQIRLGMAQGESIDDMVRRIRGTKANGYRDGVMETSKRSATAMARTSVNHVSNHAQMESFRANSDLILGWEFLATLDSRTTIICASNDGKIFPLGEGPIPPLHPSCRSSIAAVTDEAELSGKRASESGTVTDSNFEAWMKRQSTEKQNEILGKTRGDLWRDGKYQLNDFVRNNREVITLEELRGLQPEPDAFVAPPPVTKATKTKGFNPINSAVNEATITVAKRLDIQKRLRPKMTAAHAAHPFQFSEFKGGATSMGKVSFSADFDDATVSMIDAILPEIDEITDAFKVPRLRGINTRQGKFSASMGDGVMTINPIVFNGYAARLGTARAGANLDGMRDKIEAQRTKYRAALAATNQAIDGGDFDEYRRLQKVSGAIGADFEKLRKKYNSTLRKQSIKQSVADSKVAAWTIGEDLKDRPHGVQKYFTGVDSARTILYHETAHLVHQERGRTGHRRDGKPPIEIELETLFAKKIRQDRQGFFARLPSQYAGTNSKEWFAENFAAYMMGRRDLVDPDLIQLIERLLDD